MKTSNVHIKPQPVAVSNSRMSRKELEKAATDFEAVLIGQFFRLMQKTISHDGVVKRSFERGIYEDMLQNEFAKAFAKGGGMDLHEMIVDYFSGRRMVEPRSVMTETGKRIFRMNIDSVTKKNRPLPLKGQNVEKKIDITDSKGRFMNIDTTHYTRKIINEGEKK